MPPPAEALLQALAARRRFDAPLALVVAHPDDETLAVGGSLHLLPNLLLVHVTDGAPRQIGDIERLGFVDARAYGGARADELSQALAVSGAEPHRVCLGIPDQEAVDAIGLMTDRLQSLFRAHRVAAVLTHDYEGGHPDHDATCYAVARAGFPTVAFAGYHRAFGGGLVSGTFLQSLAGDVAVTLEYTALDRKRRMLDCFATQRATLAPFDPCIERFRCAPAYEFAVPPHAPPMLYEEWGWMDWAGWRRRAIASAACAA